MAGGFSLSALSLRHHPLRRSSAFDTRHARGSGRRGLHRGHDRLGPSRTGGPWSSRKAKRRSHNKNNSFGHRYCHCA